MNQKQNGKVSFRDINFWGCLYQKGHRPNRPMSDCLFHFFLVFVALLAPNAQELMCLFCMVKVVAYP